MSKVFACAMLLLPALCRAETPFAGIWVVDVPLTQYSLRPLGLLIDRGVYKRTSCVPDREVPADGTAHAISGDPLAETGLVRVLDANRVEVVEGMSGNPVWTGLYTVSKDRKTMILKYQDHRTREAVTGVVQFVREGDPVAGVHAVSGSWTPQKLLDLSPSGSTMTLRDTDNGLVMTASDGRGYDIKFDRRDYPLTGYLEGATVQVGRRATRTLQVNRKQHGTYVEMSIGTLSDDGQTMTLGQVDWQCQSKIAWTLHRQPNS